MKIVFYLGSVDEIRDAIMRDAIYNKTFLNVEHIDLSEKFKKDSSILNMIGGEKSFFSDYTIYTIYDSISSLTDSLWEKIVDCYPRNDFSSNGFKTSGFSFENSEDDNVLCISVKSIPAKHKKKLAEFGDLHTIECSKKTPQETAKLYLNTIDTLPVRAHGPMLAKVGREVQLLPLMVSELKARYTDNLANMDISSIVVDTDSVDIQKAPWDLTDAIDANRISDALKLARILCTTKTSHIGVVVILKNHYAQMHRVWASQSKDEKQAAAMLNHKGSTYPLKKAIQTSKKYGNKLPMMITLCDEAYQQLTGKSSLSNDIIVDILVARLSVL